MKIKVIVFIIYILTNNVQGQHNSFSYFSGMDEDGLSEKINLNLNADNSFSYQFVDDQVCYKDIFISFGKWEQKGDSIKLVVADTIKPKIRFKKEVLKKDTLTIFFNRANEKKFFKKEEHYYNCGKSEFTGSRQLFFYDSKNNRVEIPYKHSGKLEIPSNKKVKRIEMFLPNNNYKGNYVEIEIPENVNQVCIENLSRYVITDFEQYSFVLNKNRLIMKYPFGVYELKRED